MADSTQNIELKSLAVAPFTIIAEAFLEAFVDYGIDFDSYKLRDRLIRRGMRPELSFATFAGNRIISFILNDIGKFQGQPTAYDIGTGTISIPTFQTNCFELTCQQKH